MKKEESVRKKSLELKQKNNSYVIQILKNK